MAANRNTAKFKGVADTDLLRQVGKKVYLGSLELALQDLTTLIEEAKFVDSYLWRILKNNFQYVATMKAIRSAKTMEDIYECRAIINFLASFEKNLTDIKQLKVGR